MALRELRELAEHVQFEGLDWLHVLVFAVAWEMVYRLTSSLAARHYPQYPKVVSQGGSYATAFGNACVSSIAGWYIFAKLLTADEAGRALVQMDLEVTLVLFTAVQSFLGWLLMDVVHILTHFPDLGGADHLLHHTGFILLTSVGYAYRVFPFAVGWLLLGETSSLFLETRWFLINSGRGDTRALARTNCAFVVTFFLCRVVILWAGLYDMLTVLRPFTLAPPNRAPAWVVNTICFFVVGSALLNVFWLTKIISMARRGREGGAKRRPADEAAICAAGKKHTQQRDVEVGSVVSRASSSDGLDDMEVPPTPASPRHL